jgi:hypothetical protein
MGRLPKAVLMSFGKQNHSIGIAGWEKTLMEKSSKNTAMQPTRAAARSAGPPTRRGVGKREEAPLRFAVVARRVVEFQFMVISCQFGL